MAGGAYSWVHDNNAMHQAEYIYVWVKKDYFAAILRKQILVRKKWEK